MVPLRKVVIRLTADQRRTLRRLVHTGTHPAARRRAHILLKADADGPEAWSDQRIAQALDTTRMTVMRVRQQFAAQGLDATLPRKRPTGRQRRPRRTQSRQHLSIRLPPVQDRLACPVDGLFTNCDYRGTCTRKGDHDGPNFRHSVAIDL